MQTNDDNQELFNEKLIEKMYHHIPNAVRYSMRSFNISVNHFDIDDICHEIIVKLMINDCQYLRTFDSKSSEKTWIYTVVRNHISRWVRKNGKDLSLENVKSEYLIYAPKQEFTILELENKSQFAVLVDCLSLPARALLTMTVDGLNDSEIAKNFGITANSVRAQRHRLIKQIRKRV